MDPIAVEDVEPGAAGDRRDLADALGTTRVAVNRYRLAPGERLAGLHAHADQEEVFVVVAGTLTFETLALGRDTETDEIAVEAGEAIRFGPGTELFQSGRNDASEEAVAYAVGAPRDTEALRVPVACPECGRPDRRPVVTDGGEALACPDCGAESAVACPECGGSELRAQLARDGERPVSVCQDCGATSPAQPPTEPR